MKVFTDMDGVILEVGDTVVLAYNNIYKPKLCRGIVKSVNRSSVFVTTECDGDFLIEDESQLLYLFT